MDLQHGEWKRRRKMNISTTISIEEKATIFFYFFSFFYLKFEISDGEDFEMQILYLIRWLQTAYHEAFPSGGGDHVTAFAKEPTGYSPIVWTTALQFVEHAAALVNFDSISTYKDLNDNFSEV